MECVTTVSTILQKVIDGQYKSPYPPTIRGKLDVNAPIDYWACNPLGAFIVTKKKCDIYALSREPVTIIDVCEEANAYRKMRFEAEAISCQKFLRLTRDTDKFTLDHNIPTKDQLYSKLGMDLVINYKVNRSYPMWDKLAIPWFGRPVHPFNKHTIAFGHFKNGKIKILSTQGHEAEERLLTIGRTYRRRYTRQLLFIIRDTLDAFDLEFELGTLEDFLAYMRELVVEMSTEKL